MSAKVKKIEEAKKGVSERASILFRCIAIGGEVQNITNMLFMRKGDTYMDYCSQFPKTKVDYPNLRAAIEKDLSEAPTQSIERITTVKGEKKVKTVTVYPWGEMSIKMKAHSLAVSMLKTFQRRTLKFGKESKLTGVTLFSKFDKKENKAVTKTLDVTLKGVHKSFDEKRALDFLNSFLTPAKPAVKKAA